MPFSSHSDALVDIGKMMCALKLSSPIGLLSGGTRNFDRVGDKIGEGELLSSNVKKFTVLITIGLRFMIRQDY